MSNGITKTFLNRLKRKSLSNQIAIAVGSSLSAKEYSIPFLSIEINNLIVLLVILVKTLTSQIKFIKNYHNEGYISGRIIKKLTLVVPCQIKFRKH